MDKDHLKKAADMLLHGATLLAQPCPYCTGVRVLQDGRAFCVSCGTKPEKKDHNPEQDTPDIEQQVLELTRQLGLTHRSRHAGKPAKRHIRTIKKDDAKVHLMLRVMCVYICGTKLM